MARGDLWHHTFHLPRTDKWSVKLCRRVDDSWNVFAEGSVYGEFDEQRDQYVLIVEDVHNSESLLLRSVISPSLACQKQDTILLWHGPAEDLHCEGLLDSSEPHGEETRVRIAMGFQAAMGCATMCEFILYAASQSPQQGRSLSFTIQHTASGDPSFEGLVEIIETPPLLPPLPDRLNLTIALNMIKDLLGSVLGRELLVIYLDAKLYLDRLWDLFTEILSEGKCSDAEEYAPRNNALPSNKARLSSLERVQTLWTISDIVKQYCAVGDSLLIEEMVDSDRFPHVLSMLEYDRTFGIRKANFLEFYANHTTMKQIFEITDVPVVEKIRRTFRLQLLRDILVRSADEFTFHVIRTLIYLNHSEILEKLQNSPEFCDNLFGLFDESPYQPEPKITETKNDAIRFIYEIIKTSKTFAIAQLRPLYLAMIDSGLVNAISYGFLSSQSDAVKTIALESVSILLDFDISFMLPFRESLMKLIMMLGFKAETNHEQADKPFTRVIDIEIVEILKKLLFELPSETLRPFFAETKDTLTRMRTNHRKSPSILPFLEILVHCFSCHPEQTGMLMKEHGLWDDLAVLYDALESSGDRTVGERMAIEGRTVLTPVEVLTSSRSGEASYLSSSNRLSTRRSMALIRLVREAIQPLSVASTSSCVEQSECIISSGLLGAITRRHVRAYVHQVHMDDAEQSSFLSLMNTILEGRSSTAARQFKLLTTWLLNEGIADTQVLCEMYPFMRKVLPEAQSGGVPRGPLLKRPHSSSYARFGGPAGHQSQRLRQSSPQRQIVDEVDEEILILPQSSFAAQYQQDSGARLGDEPQKLSPPSGPQCEDGLRGGAGFGGRDSSTGQPTKYQRTAPHSAHPWWESPKLADDKVTVRLCPDPAPKY